MRKFEVGHDLLLLLNVRVVEYDGDDLVVEVDETWPEAGQRFRLSPETQRNALESEIG